MMIPLLSHFFLGQWDLASSVVVHLNLIQDLSHSWLPPELNYGACYLKDHLEIKEYGHILHASPLTI